jgi:hypothetical protein
VFACATFCAVPHFSERGSQPISPAAPRTRCLIAETAALHPPLGGTCVGSELIALRTIRKLLASLLLIHDGAGRAGAIGVVSRSTSREGQRPLIMPSGVVHRGRPAESLIDAQRKTRGWAYNEEPPHSAIGNKAAIELIDRSGTYRPPTENWAPPGSRFDAEDPIEYTLKSQFTGASTALGPSATPLDDLPQLIEGASCVVALPV